MFRLLGRTAVRYSWVVIAAWIALAAAAVVLLPTLASAVNPDTTSFLPKAAEASRAATVAKQDFPDRPKSTAVAVFHRQDGAPLSSQDSEAVRTVVAGLQEARIATVVKVSTGQNGISADRKVQLAQVSFSRFAYDDQTRSAVAELRRRGGELLRGTPLRMGMTGEAAIGLDNKNAVGSAAAIVAAGTVGLIILLQLIIFRSPIAALLPVVTALLAQIVAGGIVGGLARLLDFDVSDTTPTLLTVVLFGIGTDYILFLLFRYRERLRGGEDPKTAMVETVARVGEAITSAGGAVIVAFGTLTLATLGIISSLGPALAVGTAVMMLAGLTLVPAVVSLLGTRVFWPSRAWRRTPSSPVATRIGRLVSRRPGGTAVASGGLLLALAAGTVGFALDYNPVGQLPQSTESASAFRTLRSEFPAGVLNPATVYLRSTGGSPLPTDAASTLASSLQAVPGVATVLPPSPNAAGTAVSLNVILKVDPYSASALDVVSGPLSSAAHAAAPSGTEALVGGASSAYAGIRAANSRDLRVILPVAGGLIALILALLLRSVAAPLYLIPAVVLGFAGTLGAAVLVFQRMLDKPGLQFTIPIVLYTFVVAIGTDYNILVMSRLREELREHADPRQAAEIAVSRSAATVASAGLVLAGAFASMMLAGIGFLAQMGFAVSLGIALASLVMAILFVPSMTVLLGRRAWWPSRPQPGRPQPAPAPPVRQPQVQAVD